MSCSRASSAVRQVAERDALEVHAGVAGFGNGQAGEHRFVSDRDAMLVDAHLAAPHPGRSAQQEPHVARGVGQAVGRDVRDRCRRGIRETGPPSVPDRCSWQTRRARFRALRPGSHTRLTVPCPEALRGTVPLFQSSSEKAPWRPSPSWKRVAPATVSPLSMVSRPSSSSFRIASSSGNPHCSIAERRSLRMQLCG